MIEELLNLGTTVQVWIGAGYISYCTAYAGFQRHHKTRETVFLTAVFTAISSIAFAAAQDANVFAAYALAILVPFVIAVFWRRVGKSIWLSAMKLTRVHREDGNASTWESIVQTDKAVDQISVHMQDGRVLYLNNRRQFKGKVPWDGLYLGGDGSIVMVVEEEEFPDGKTEQREAICSDWGARLTYLPSDQIVRVNIRLG